MKNIFNPTKQITIIALLLLFVNCNHKSKINLIKNHLKESKLIKGKIISKSNSILKEPSRMIYKNPYLVYYSYNDGKLIKLFDINKGAVTNRFCNQGKGPQELMMIGNLHLADNSQISLYDIIKKKIFTIDIETGKLSEKATIKSQANQAFIKNKNIIIVNGIFHDARFKVLQDDSIISTFKKFPHFAMEDSDTSFLNMGYQNITDISPNCKNMANIIYESEIIEGFVLNEYRPFLKRSWNHEWHIEPFTQVKIGSGALMAKHSENSFGFKDMVVNNNHIYCVYCELPTKAMKPLTDSGKYLIVFDWNGNIEKTYKLDHPVRTIAISRNGKDFFATTIIDNDIKILKYEL